MDWRRGISCYDEHIEKTDDPVLGCFARDSNYIVVPSEYKQYLPNNMTNISTLPAFENDAIMHLTVETDIPESAVGEGVKDGGGDTSSSESDCSGALSDKYKVKAATTKKRSAQSQLQAVSSS